MAHMRKSATTGHILKTASGHIAKSCGGIDNTNCHTSCSHTSFPGVIAGTTATEGVYPCGCLNATYTMAYGGRLTSFVNGDSDFCSALNDLVGRNYCFFHSEKLCDASPFLTDVLANLQLWFFEGSPSGAIDVVARLHTGWWTGFASVNVSLRYWRDTISAANICEAMNFVRTTGFDCNGSNLLCYFEETPDHACDLDVTTVNFGP